MKTILLTIHFPTENADYEGVSVNFTFTGSIPMEQLCHTVATVEDTIVENTEFFTLSLTSSESQIVIPIDSVPVVIEDDDGKHVNSIHQMDHNFCCVADVALQFTREMYNVSESEDAEQVCVEIASGYTIARSIPFTIQSVLLDDTTAEGIANYYFLTVGT